MSRFRWSKVHADVLICAQSGGVASAQQIRRKATHTSLRRPRTRAIHSLSGMSGLNVALGPNCREGFHGFWCRFLSLQMAG